MYGHQSPPLLKMMSPITFGTNDRIPDIIAISRSTTDISTMAIHVCMFLSFFFFKFKFEVRTLNIKTHKGTNEIWRSHKRFISRQKLTAKKAKKQDPQSRPNAEPSRHVAAIRWLQTQLSLSCEPPHVFLHLSVSVQTLIIFAIILHSVSVAHAYSII